MSPLAYVTGNVLAKPELLSDTEKFASYFDVPFPSFNLQFMYDPEIYPSSCLLIICDSPYPIL